MRRLINRRQVELSRWSFDDVELRASQQLVGIIDVLLALTLVEGAVFYRSVFTTPSTANVAVVLAMVLVYYTAIRSFMDWHIAMEQMRYRILTDGYRTSELVRVFLDFAIMASYSFLLLRAHVLIADQSADLLAIAITYPAIYALYFIWDALLRKAHPTSGAQFSQPLILLTTAVAAAILVVYILGRKNQWIFSNNKDFNIALLVAELLLLFTYRQLNWLQQVRMPDVAHTVPFEYRLRTYATAFDRPSQEVMQQLSSALERASSDLADKESTDLASTLDQVAGLAVNLGESIKHQRAGTVTGVDVSVPAPDNKDTST